MNKQILIISVVIALMLLATMSTAGSDANDGGKVWSDGYVELTLNKMERTDTIPLEFIFTQYFSMPINWLFMGPKKEHDFAVINLTLTRIEGRSVLIDPYSILFDENGDNYTCGYMVQGVTFRTETGVPVAHLEESEYREANESSKWLLLSEMPKDREPVSLWFIYNYTESWENVFIKKGQIEVEFEEVPLVCGDVDGDGSLTITDARIIVGKMYGQAWCAGYPDWAADVDCDKSLTITDARIIVGKMYGQAWCAEYNCCAV